MALKPLQEDQKWYFQKGHDIEGTYTKQLIAGSMSDKFPLREIETISEVGLVQKLDKPYVKYSIDRNDWLLTKRQSR